MTSLWFISTRHLLLLCLGFLQTSNYFCAVKGFAPASVVVGLSSRTSILPSSSSSRTTTELSAFRRRDILRGIRRVLFAGALAKTTADSSPPEPAQALALQLEDIPTTGRVVEFQLSNLEGISDRTGRVKIQLCPEWAPRGVARFEELTTRGFWNQCRIFRVIPGFVAQFGIHGNPAVQAEWRSAPITDDPVRVSNVRGTVAFGHGGPMSRTSQIFINTRPQGNAFLDPQGFAPIGVVIEGMDIVDQSYSGYGEGEPEGSGPNQAVLQQRGSEYLAKFPKLSYISKATFLS